MKITLKNIGPVKESTIDLDKDLIVLTGGNNTGKTYVAYSIYGIFKFWRSIAHAFPDHKSLDHILNDEFPNVSTSISFKKYQDEIFKLIKTFPSKSYNLIKANFELNSANPLFTDSRYEIDFDEEILSQKVFEKEIYNAGSSIGSTIVLANKKRESEEIIIHTENYGDLSENHTFNKEASLKSIAKSTIFNPFIAELFKNRPYIEPAERSSINIFNTEIVLYRSFGRVQEFGQNKEQIRYPRPIEDALNIASDLKFISKGKSKFSFLATKLEEEFLGGGQIKISEHGEAEYSTPNNTNLKIHLTASVVKSLSSLIFYFRHMAQEGDFIIIDEPELNLHPDNQRKIARWLVRVVNAGFKVMITTHSDYIVRELNNLIMLQTGKNKEIKAQLMEEFGYEEEELLDPEKLGAYLFTKKGECLNLDVDETGFEVESIDQEISKLNNTQEKIFYGLHDEEDLI